MSKARIMGKKYFWVDEQGTAHPVETVEQDRSYTDERQVHLRISLNARGRKDVLKNSFNKYRLIQNLKADGVIDPGGCNCGHCQRGYDCCGRLFVSSTKVVPAKRGVTVIQHYSRNI